MDSTRFINDVLPRLTRTGLIAAGLSATLVATPAFASAILVSDGFGDGDRNNNGTSDIADGSSVDDPTDVGVPFWKAKGSTNQEFSLVNDDDGIGSGLALKVEPIGSNNPTVVAHFTTTTLNDGDVISLSFDARITDPPATSQDRRFRWGLFASNSTDTDDFQKSSDGGTTADNVNHWSGFIGRVDVGPASGGAFSINQNDPGSLLSADEFLAGSDDPDAALSTTDAKHFTLTLERMGDHMIVTASVDGVVLTKDTLDAMENDDRNISPIAWDFDSLGIGYNGWGGSPFLVDNVNVTYTPIPEPGTLGLLGLGALAMLRRRK